MAKGSTRRERATAQAKPRSEGRPAVPSTKDGGILPPVALARHILWFFPSYVGLLGALYLAYLFLKSGFADRNLGMAFLGIPVPGFLAEIPWIRFLDRAWTRDREGTGGPAPGTAGTRH